MWRMKISMKKFISDITTDMLLEGVTRGKKCSAICSTKKMLCTYIANVDRDNGGSR